MKPNLLAMTLVVSLPVLRSDPIRAGVVAVSVSPASPTVNQAATVTVTGQDPCGAVHIDFGDGIAQTYPITGLPFITQHTWSTTGSKTITATGQGNCTGQATVTLQVTQSRGGVVAVSIAPASPSVNQAATVTITGQNPCGAAIINFGDGGIAQTTHFTSLPFSTQHTWTTPGAKTVTAIGQGTCTGHASQNIQVTQSSNILQLCATINCGERPMFPLSPQITALFGFNTPGGILAIAGKGFGTKPGTVVASLQTWSGASVQEPLEVTEWSNTMVGLRWPADIAGVRQQSGTLVLTNAGGVKSAPRSMTFQPELDLKTLSQADVQVVSCSGAGNRNVCNSHGFYGVGPSVWFLHIPKELAAEAAIVGAHFNRAAAIGNDKGTDSYRIALKNDWTMESFEWRVSVEPQQGAARKPTGFTKGPTWSPSVEWEVTPSDQVVYAVVVTISGPRGVPHK